ncbi:hypothetical protein AHiyo4_17210 [Arthrobacter sp. Hiyo4]|nr:hypothetical protein AHiyo4_17210 [Arthrobacter sp. Hiyo4]
MIAAVGLSLGGLEVNLAIILVHYALLFLCILPFLGLKLKALCAWAAGWIVVSPVLAYLLRPWLMAANPPLHLGTTRPGKTSRRRSLCWETSS